MSTSSSFEVAILQLASPAEETIEARRLRAMSLVQAQRGADLVILPELWLPGYFRFSSYLQLSETLEGPTIRELSSAAREIGAYVHGGSFVYREGGSIFNLSVLFSPTGDLIHTQAKVHVFGIDSEEAEIVSGAKSFSVVDTRFGSVGMAACYDLRFPELFRAMVCNGAELILITAAWPADRVEHWDALLRCRAIENLTFVIAANAAGEQEGTKLAGRSQIIGPWGERLCVAGDEDSVIHCRLDLAELASRRAHFPVLKDMRLAPRTELWASARQIADVITPSSHLQEEDLLLRARARERVGS